MSISCHPRVTDNDSQNPQRSLQQPRQPRRDNIRASLDRKPRTRNSTTPRQRGALDVETPTRCDREQTPLPWRTTPTDDPASRTPAGRLLTSCDTSSMANRSDGYQFHFDPASYLERIRAEVPAYDELQDVVADATAGIQAQRVLDLGVGTGRRLGGCSTSTQRLSWSASTRVRRCSLPRP
jgi:hypothetical protein